MAAPGCWAGALPTLSFPPGFPRIGLEASRRCHHGLRRERVCDHVDVCRLCVLTCITVGTRIGTCVIM